MLNSNLEKLEYVFASVSQKVKKAKSSGAKIIDMGIGDVTLPLGKTVVDAGVNAIAEMGCNEGFRGYGDSSGYDFLKDAVAKYYEGRVRLFRDEIFISDGAKSDCSGITDLFFGNVFVTDPSYPVYVNSNIIAGNFPIFLQGNVSNGFKPAPDGNVPVEAVYICSPANPTGVVYTRSELAEWVRYARRHRALIIFDCAYEAYITENCPHSIFEIEGAEDVAIEINSFSKSAGFTGLRCGYTVIKNERLKKMWKNRQASKSNGVSYPIQRMAEAAYSEQGKSEWRQNVAYYLDNAGLLLRAIKRSGTYCVGGVNSPYVWFDCGRDSEKFFDELLKYGLVATPGAGFGKSAKNFMRVTGFSSRENTKIACEILSEALKR